MSWATPLGQLVAAALRDPTFDVAALINRLYELPEPLDTEALATLIETAERALLVPRSSLELATRLVESGDVAPPTRVAQQRAISPAIPAVSDVEIEELRAELGNLAERIVACEGEAARLEST